LSAVVPHICHYAVRFQSLVVSSPDIGFNYESKMTGHFASLVQEEHLITELICLSFVSNTNVYAIRCSIEHLLYVQKYVTLIIF